jgi:hypothetical protein
MGIERIGRASVINLRCILSKLEVIITKPVARSCPLVSADLWYRSRTSALSGRSARYRPTGTSVDGLGIPNQC